jgi:hypothetical protein
LRHSAFNDFFQQQSSILFFTRTAVDSQEFHNFSLKVIPNTFPKLCLTLTM